MEKDLISLEEAIPQEAPAMPLVSLTGGEKFIVNEETAQRRAKETNFALGDQSPGEESIYNAISTGSEADFRAQVAVAQDSLKTAQRTRQIEEIAQKPVLTPEDMNTIMGLTSGKPTAPESVLEELYAKQAVKTAVEANPDSDGVFKAGQLSEAEYKMAEDVIAKDRIVNNAIEDVEARWKATGMFDTVWDFGEQIVPGLQMFQAWGIDTGKEDTEGFLTGDVIQSKVQELWSLPPDEMAKQLPKTLQELADTNIFLARQFAQAMKNYDKNSQFTDNLFAVVDVADVGIGSAVGIARRAAKGAARNVVETSAELAAREARRKGLADITKAAGADPADITAMGGNIGKAAEMRVLNPTPIETVEDVAKTLPSAFRVDNIMSNIGTLSREATERLRGAFTRAEEVMSNALSDPLRVGRLTPEQQRVALKEAYQQLEKDFSGPNDAILDIRLDNIDANAANVQTVTMRIGADNATTFPSQELAEFYARELYGIPEFKIGQEGGNFFIEVRKAVDETTDGVRGAIVETTVPDTNQSLGDVFMGFLKNPGQSIYKAMPDFLKSADELLAKGQNENRKAAEFGFQETMRIARELVQPVMDLSKKQRKDLEKVLHFNRNYIDQKTGERGMFYKTIGDLEDGYMQRVGRLPTEKEIEAYYNQVKLYDLDWSIRNLTLYREKARIGLKRFNFQYKTLDEEGKPLFKEVGDFEGKEVDDIPWTTAENASVLLYDDVAGPVVFQKNSIDGATREGYQQLLKEGGYKVIQVDNPISLPFKAVTGDNEPVRFVMVRNYDKKELSAKQLNYNPGGHVEYQHPWFIKQPKIIVGKGGQHFYGGDFTVFNFATEAQARKFEKAMNTARQYLLDKDDAGLSAFLKGNLPYTADQFKTLFKGADALDLKETFHVVKTGRKIGDEVDLKGKYANLKDYTSSEYDLSGEVNRKYVGARSGPLMTIQEKGTDANPLFKFTPAKLVDPLPTLARSIANASNTRHLADYKVSAVEDWIARYGKFLKATPQELAHNPMYHIHNPVWDESNLSPALWEAKSARSAILNLTGAQTELGRRIEVVKQKLYNSVYNSFGQDTANKIVDLTDNGLGGMKDPASYMRGMAFHLSLGLFNPVQLFTQAQGMANIIALSPKHGFAGSSAYMATRWALRNPTEANIRHLGGVMSKLGWKQEDFVEAVTALKETGWANIGREYAWRADLEQPPMFSGGVGSWLDKGTIFFKEGEQVVRISSWMTAYREWKAANPSRTFNAAARRQVLDRADLLSVNMTHASQAAMQRGLFSIPTQFMGYQLRLMDQFMGKRLTSAEKMRLFGTYSALYGVPTAIGAATLYPFYDDVRQTALERGLDDNVVVKGLTEGISGMVSGLIAGEDQNVASRYGPGGIRLGDKGFMEVMLGAGGSALGRVFGSMYPLLNDLYEVTTEGGSYEPVIQDVIDVSRNIGSVNSAVRTLMALNTGKYYSRTGTYLMDVNAQQAVFSGITGLEPLQLSDAWLKIASQKNLAELEKEAKKEYNKYIQRGTEEYAKGNKEAAKAWWTKARAVIIAADLNHRKANDFIRDSLAPRQSLVDSANQSFMRNAPASQTENREQRFLRQGN